MFTTYVQEISKSHMGWRNSSNLNTATIPHKKTKESNNCI